MAISDNKTALKNVRNRNFLARDFDGFRTVLLDYARQYYPTRIADFSESSVGGLFLDMAAYVGDNLSFYLDHLYGELNSDTVVETSNIERTLRNSGVPISGASSSTATVDFYIEVPVAGDGTLEPEQTLIPTINARTTIQADNSVEFTLLEDVKFWVVDADSGVLSVDPSVDMSNGRRIGNKIVSKILKKSGVCTSGTQTTETFAIGDFVQFRRIDLSNPNVTQILSVTDSLGNTYYEVASLTHDVVYVSATNNAVDSSYVRDKLKVVPAPYRFMKEVSLAGRNTTLIFGGGTADNLEDDIIPDPSEFAIPLPHSQMFSRVPVNPQQMLQTSTLGIAGSNTTLSVTYMHGGGLSHNVEPNTIRSITNLSVSFPMNPTPAQQAQVKNTIEASNPNKASGGEDALTQDELLALMPTVKNSQERIVTKEDLLARVYTMPSNFGRVFRASISKNPNNPLASILHVVSRTSDGELMTSPDSLKINLKRYLNSYRMVSDAIDIRDAAIINLSLYFQVVVDPSLNKNLVLQSIIKDLTSQFEITKMHIGQPIVVSDVEATIYSKTGVISVDTIKFECLHGRVNNIDYSPITFDVKLNTRNKIIYPPDGAIFELKNPALNIVGKATSNV